VYLNLAVKEVFPSPILLFVLFSTRKLVRFRFLPMRQAYVVTSFLAEGVGKYLGWVSFAVDHISERLCCGTDCFFLFLLTAPEPPGEHTHTPA
jgi:hypothetical protein